MGISGRGLAVVCVCAVWAWPGRARAERIVYLNPDPLALNNAGGQDPTMDSYSSNGFTPGTISGWPALTDEQRAELEFWLKEATVPFDIHFTWERPAAGPYDMLVMGTATDFTNLFGAGCSTALSLADCGDAEGDNVSFLFWGCLGANDQDDMHRVAFTALTALGFGWGLENLAVQGQIGGGYTFNGLVFGSSCVATNGQLCTDHIGCPAGQQNSTLDLNARVGTRVDDGPPMVTITAPADNSDVDSTFDIVADVSDGFGGLTVTLDIVEAAQELTVDVPPYEWGLSNVPAGVWTLRVVVVDADGNESTDEVVVCVDDPTCGGVGPGDSSGGGDSGGQSTGAADESGGGDPDDGGGTTGDADGDTEAGTEDDGGGDTGGINPTMPFEPTSFGGAEPGSGCTCRTGSPLGFFAWGLGLLGLWLGRRRRDEA